MYKKSLSLTLVSFLIVLICITSVSAVVPTDTETQRIAKMKERISVIQLQQKRVVITRQDGMKLTGRISEVKESSFFISDEQANTIIEVKYDDATRVKTKGKGLSTSTKVLIGVGVVAAAVVLLFVIKPLGKSPFPKCNADMSNAPCSR